MRTRPPNLIHIAFRLLLGVAAGIVFGVVMLRFIVGERGQNFACLLPSCSCGKTWTQPLFDKGNRYILVLGLSAGLFTACLPALLCSSRS